MPNTQTRHATVLTQSAAAHAAGAMLCEGLCAKLQAEESQGSHTLRTQNSLKSNGSHAVQRELNIQ